MIVPSIDIGAFLDPKSTQEARQEVVNQVENACRQIGFLVITNHGIPSQIIQEAFQSAKEYFNQSEDVKKQILMTPDYPYGYENGEILSQSIEKSGSKADLKETFQICLGAVGKVPAYEPKWPKQLDTFKQVMTNYYRSIEKLSSIMMKIFAIALKLPSNWFDDKIDNHMSSLRIL
jgi:isopenicillin N synthase-like dioxygenase